MGVQVPPRTHVAWPWPAVIRSRYGPGEQHRRSQPWGFQVPLGHVLTYMSDSPCTWSNLPGACASHVPACRLSVLRRTGKRITYSPPALPTERLVCGRGPYALPGFAVALGHVLAHSERHSTSDHLHGSIVIDAHLVAVSIRLQNVADLLGGDTETFTDLGNGKRIGTRRGAFPDVNVEPSGLVAALSARRAVAAARLQSGRREQNCCQVPALRTSRPR
jgi:hypothetical protein